MLKYVALGFQNHEDFEVCNSIMNIQPGDTATSSDGMFTVLVRVERILIPHGTLMVTTDKGKRIFIRVTSGTEKKATKEEINNIE
jgi:hypothetical protein